MLTATCFSIYEQWGYCFVNRYGLDPPERECASALERGFEMAVIDSDPNNSEVQFRWQKLGDYHCIDAVAMSQQTTQWSYTPNKYSRLGWAGAGLWYHNVAWINGSMVSALADIPFVVKYPSVMEDVKKSRAKSDKNSSGEKLYRPVAATDQHPEGTKTDSQGDKIASVLWQAYDAWNHAYNVNPSSNFITDLIKAVTGTTGLFALTDPANINVHPLALLVDIGKSMMNAALINLAGAVRRRGGVQDNWHRRLKCRYGSPRNLCI